MYRLSSELGIHPDMPQSSSPADHCDQRALGRVDDVILFGIQNLLHVELQPKFTVTFPVALCQWVPPFASAHAPPVGMSFLPGRLDQRTVGRPEDGVSLKPPPGRPGCVPTIGDAAEFVLLYHAE